MPRIRQLDAGVVNKIAAGEVIERPASVVKELLENSIDAASTRIDVDISAGGTELIRIVDDGHGIDAEDLPLAIASHATSKLQSAEDLFRVRTLGFRGEALASIASVSRLRIRSRTPGHSVGAELEVNAGDVGPVRSCGCAEGTLIEIRQLFQNTPVRRKFLKTIGTEFSHISEQFTRVALAHPRLHLMLRHNEKLIHELPPTSELRERLRLFYDRELVEELIAVDSTVDDVRLWGYVAPPHHTKSTRKSQHLFLNGRWIQDRSLSHALAEAYRGLMMTGRHPIAFLFLEMPPDQADVNVHPTKAEVRFRNGQQLYRQLLAALRTKFLGMNLQSNLRLPDQELQSVTPPNPARQQELQMEFASWAKQQLSVAQLSQPAERLYEAIPPTESETAPVPEITSTAQNSSVPAPLSDRHSVDSPAAFKASEFPDPPDHSATADVETIRPQAGGVTSSPVRAMQVHDCYLVVETDDGLTVIDQHALHERILYEHLRERVLRGDVESQQMLIPAAVEFTSSEAALLLDHTELLAELGFGIEEFGKGTLLITRYPALLGGADLTRLLQDVADQLGSSDQLPTRRDLLDSLLHMMSCKAAIKAGRRLSAEEIDGLLSQRHLVDDAHHCPHGRPTSLTLSRAALDRQFGRLG